MYMHTYMFCLRNTYYIQTRIPHQNITVYNPGFSLIGQVAYCGLRIGCDWSKSALTSRRSGWLKIGYKCI